LRCPKTTAPKRSWHSVASAHQAVLVFVVDVSSLTKKGFIGSTKYMGRTVELEFDDRDAGVFLSPEMAARLRVRKGSGVSLILENGRNQVANATVAGVGKTVRISNSKVYYGVGKEGGAILRIQKS
jgi:ABC-type lipoprotein release transport system permease subunit